MSPHSLRPQTHAPVTDRKVRFALVGCGRIAANHMESVKVHAGRAEMIAVCDPDPARLAAAVERTGARGYPSLEAMLAAETPDCVIITTPSGLHSQQVIQVARAGFNVMTEKPMATRWQDGLAMVRACDEAGVHLFVVKQNRRNKTLQLLKKAMELGRFGRIYTITVNVFWTRPQEYYDSASWRGTSNTVSRALALIAEGALDGEGAGVEALAERLGVGERQLRRLFLQHLGASPISVAQTPASPSARAALNPSMPGPASSTQKAASISASFATPTPPANPRPPAFAACSNSPCKKTSVGSKKIFAP